MINRKYFREQLIGQKVINQINIYIYMYNIYIYQYIFIYSLQINQKKDLRQYLFEPMNVYMLVAKSKTTQQINYQKYLRLFINALNQTIDQDQDFFSLQNFETNDYLYFIEQNKQNMIQQNILNMQKLDQILINLIETIKTQFLSKWSLQFIFIFVSFIFIYPSLLQSNVKIHDSLVLFTKISLKDIDFYSEHYKRIYLCLNSIENTSSQTKEVEKIVLNEKIMQNQNKKMQDSRSVNRTRLYKGVKINKINYFLKIFGIALFFLTFVALKDYPIFLYVEDMEILKNLHIKQHNLMNNHTYYSLYYFDLLKYIIDNYQDQQIEDTYQQFIQYKQKNATDILMENFLFFGKLDIQYQTFVTKIMNDNICLNVMQFNQYFFFFINFYFIFNQKYYLIQNM
ncbi:hypothetical protein IMG5_119960 [Ichthyophthirius multifiliis]|uniref:Transmembrane protein n=1 Tax=Ichthyophthirius multifiliis TaxID=5932 RepID=G0QUX5_ICHMU|nr:hypothetical protein IMG5_119960 [Ichthyophthirius multifiliis]EGR30980.1 hypothetical protein IMG5_119960 [Ichthyophthirius multifiliis]|eukprot:XP_004034466.1 hypothetical protein IMG5_119960 [Ichthyophthirius multifiliis]